VIAGILLAAGRGSRFGGHKLLHPLASGKAMAALAAEHLLSVVPCSIAVCRPGDQALIGILTDAGLDIVVCERSAEGMGASVSCGVQATRRASGWIIALADMPLVRPDTIRAVVTLLGSGAQIAAPAYRGQRGHPVGFSAACGDELAQLAGDRGARLVLERHPGRLQLQEVDDPGCLLDIDTREDALSLDSGRDARTGRE
jgi:molybdenum cofactor cytidylyltransferase